MLVIGHRGAAGIAPENTLEALHAGVDAGADILEFDVHMTNDRVPVVIHDGNLLRTHRKRAFINRISFAKLQELTADSPNPVIALETVLDEFFGDIILNIEIKQRGIAADIIDLLERRYIKHPHDWEVLVFSSFYASELVAIRKRSHLANLWLLHNRNPFIFIAFARRLHLSGVGFHRLYINDFALAIAKKTHLFTYAYTVNRPHAARQLSNRGIDGIVTDYPAKILHTVSTTQPTN